MPRDRLGRIVYAGDVVDALGTVEAVSGGMLLFKSFLGHLPFAAGNVRVDLAASPERTNYERYFADLGTFDEVIKAADSCVFDKSIFCLGCPLDDWGVAFEMPYVDCGAFNTWLNETAVV